MIKWQHFIFPQLKMYMIGNKWFLHTVKPYSDQNHVMQIKMKHTMHRVILALLWSGLSSESLLGPLNSATKELGLRSRNIFITSITMVPGSPKPWFRLFYPPNQSTLKVASQVWHKKQQIWHKAGQWQQPVLTTIAGGVCWELRAHLSGETTQRCILEKLASTWWKLLLREIKAAS